MLKHLYIQNFILIEKLNIDFESGFSALIGETGAGKSIMIDALGILAGDRASISFIASNADKAIIEATFDLTDDPHAKQIMTEAGLDILDETTFTKEISRSGKTTTRIDHRIVTASLMKDILKYEIDIHGQRDNAYLLNTNTHIHLLDQFLGNQNEVEKVRKSYQKYHSLVLEKKHALEEVYNENDLEYFQFEVEEIEQANLQIGEDEELLIKEKEYKQYKESIDVLNQINTLYEQSLSDSLYELQRQVQSLKNEDLSEIQTDITDGYYLISNAMEQLSSTISDFSISEEEINEMEERLFEIQRLKRKYGNSIEIILQKRDELEKQIEQMTHRQEYLDDIDKKINQALVQYQTDAQILSDIRKSRSHELDQRIASILIDLMLPNARFETVFTPIEPSLHGNEKVEFLISMNKGESLKPLSKTASGGELSRLMLGLKVIFSRLQGIQTIIFDEIDTGVSGPVASAIGKKMKELSNNTQVFSVTHLAQVAACSDHQYFVYKQSDDDHTSSFIRRLSVDETIEQLAFIASGEITDASLNAARELYQRNHS